MPLYKDCGQSDMQNLSLLICCNVYGKEVWTALPATGRRTFIGLVHCIVIDHTLFDYTETKIDSLAKLVMSSSVVITYLY